MDLYEHMGKDLFRAHGIETPRGMVAFSAADAASATRELGGRSVVKIQVQVGAAARAVASSSANRQTPRPRPRTGCSAPTSKASR